MPLSGSFKIQQKANSTISEVQGSDLEHMTGIYTGTQKETLSQI